LGHSLDMEVVAEGVESEKQVRLLQAMKLDNIQGYFYARPLSGFDYLRFLEKHPYHAYLSKGKEAPSA
jgi:EAL domain-containing protein (putative c-di-GMP-specific phosphodiesterase class I)